MFDGSLRSSVENVVAQLCVVVHVPGVGDADKLRDLMGKCTSAIGLPAFMGGLGKL